MTLKTIRTGIIGLGVGERHLASYQAIPGCEVTAICDLDAEKLNEVGDRRGIGERYSDWKQITEHPDIDVVSICSYDEFHASQAVSAFSHGKHVMVEKPVALHKQDAEAVVRAMEDNGRFITSNFILRHSPRFKALKKMIEAGEFGDIFYLEGDYIHQILWKITEGWRGKQDFYCVTYGGGIHLIDLMMWLMGGQKVIEANGMGNKMLTANSSYPFPDTIVNLLRFEQGALAKTATTFGPKRTHFHALNVYGTERTFVNGIPDAKIFSGDQPEDEAAMTVPYPAYDKGDLLPEFIEAIRQGREPLVGAKDVFRVMDVCFAAWESVCRRKTVAVSYLI
jgi:predicted dehydrogenase